MKAKNNRIYIDQWLEIKPYDKQVITDAYYLKISNEVKQSILKSEYSLMLSLYYDEDDIGDLACFLTSYFEDLISGTQIWNSFVRLHKKHYGKPLPFFETDEYYEEEINQSDICFLIWYYTNTFQNKKFVSPNNDFIYHLAAIIMDIFDREWEYAPENESLRIYYQIDPNETDYYIVRHVIDNMLFKTYLFYPDTGLDFNEALMEVVEDFSDDQNLLGYFNETRDVHLHTSHTRLLALPGKEWVAQLLGKEHPLCHELKNMSKRILGYFLYKGQDQNYIHLEHIASGKRFNVTKKSLEHPEDFKKVDRIIFMGIVKWMNEWWFSGLMMQSKYNPDLILDEKNSIISRKQVDFLDYGKNKMNELLQQQLTIFKKYNKNRQIAFIKGEELDAFLKGYYEFYNQSLNLTKEDKAEARQRAKDEGYLGENGQKFDISEKPEDVLVFFNPKSGVEIAFGVNSAFPDKDNPFFNENETEDSIMTIFFNEQISKELAKYCVENYGNYLEFFKSKEGEFFQSNLDFLLRFFKKENYHTTPAITLTGQQRLD